MADRTSSAATRSDVPPDPSPEDAPFPRPKRSAAQGHEEALLALETVEAAYSTGCQEDLDATPDALLKLRRYLEETKP